MRNGTKLKQLLTVCDLSITMDDNGVIVITTINKANYQNRQKEGATFSAVLDKAYRQMLKDASAGYEELWALFGSAISRPTINAIIKNAPEAGFCPLLDDWQFIIPDT